MKMTKIEIVVIIGIVFALLSILMPTLQRAKEASQQQQQQQQKDHYEVVLYIPNAPSQKWISKGMPIVDRRGNVFEFRDEKGNKVVISGTVVVTKVKD